MRKWCRNDYPEAFGTVNWAKKAVLKESIKGDCNNTPFGGWGLNSVCSKIEFYVNFLFIHAFCLCYRFNLLKILRRYGEIAQFDYLFHKTGPNQGKPRGYCFVSYKTREVCMHFELSQLIDEAKKIISMFPVVHWKNCYARCIFFSF